MTIMMVMAHHTVRYSSKSHRFDAKAALSTSINTHRQMRPLSNAAAALGRSRRPRPLSSAAPPFLLPARRLLASSSSSSAADGKEETHEDTDTNETAHFNVVAAEARSDPSRRFRVSTDGEKRQKGA